MAIFHMSVKACQRSKGQSAVAAAAYRAGQALTDTRTGQVFDYTRKRGVELAELFVPVGEAVLTRQELWSKAELAERRKDGMTGREYELALPAELTASQQDDLARAFTQYIVGRYGVAADMCIHAPSRKGDSRNRHAHLFTTTRKLEGGQLTVKAAGELSDRDRKARGLPLRSEEIETLRRTWALFANRALEKAGQAVTVTEKSFKAQGLDTLPTVHLGPAATAMERKGIATQKGDLNRSRMDVRQLEAQLAKKRAAKKLLEAEREKALLQAKKEKEAALTRADERPTAQPETRSVDAAPPVQTPEKVEKVQIQPTVALFEEYRDLYAKAEGPRPSWADFLQQKGQQPEAPTRAPEAQKAPAAPQPVQRQPEAPTRAPEAIQPAPAPERAPEPQKVQIQKKTTKDKDKDKEYSLEDLIGPSQPEPSFMEDFVRRAWELVRQEKESPAQPEESARSVDAAPPAPVPERAPETAPAMSKADALQARLQREFAERERQRKEAKKQRERGGWSR